MIESIEDLRLDRVIERHQIDHHSCLRVYRPAHQNFNKVIVTVAMIVVALAVRGAILFGGKSDRMQPVACAEHVAPAEVGFVQLVHSPPRYSAKISGVS